MCHLYWHCEWPEGAIIIDKHIYFCVASLILNSVILMAQPRVGVSLLTTNAVFIGKTQDSNQE